MVMAVCRGVLGRSHDVEDAFQATFLALVQHAGTIRSGESLGPWLHRVALRVARRARATAARRRTREIRRARPETEPPHDLSDAATRPVLDEELRRLPDRYRLPLILCYLEGKTNEQAAAELDWPVGTVKGRLWRARNELRDRLSRRGLVPYS
jgi:RNA polymerase sigma factor (sigma-70 family)